MKIKNKKEKQKNVRARSIDLKRGVFFLGWKPNDRKIKQDHQAKIKNGTIETWTMNTG